MELDTLALGDALALRFEAEPSMIVCHCSMVSRAPVCLGVDVGLVGAERLAAVLSGVDACAACAAFAVFSRLRPFTTWLIRRS